MRHRTRGPDFAVFFVRRSDARSLGPPSVRERRGTTDVRSATARAGLHTPQHGHVRAQDGRTAHRRPSWART
eukprot:4846531-Pyramimonas_sp.AAC.1